MADDECAGAVESIGSVQMLPLDEQRRRAVSYDRMSLRKYLAQGLLLVAVGVLITLIVEYSVFHPGSRPWWMLLVMPLILLVLLTAYFIDNRRAAGKDLRSGTYACYSGPLRLQVYVSSSNHKRNDTRTYKLVLGTFTEISVDGHVLTHLQQHLPPMGQADVAVHLQDLMEIRDEGGTVVFTGAWLTAVRNR
jgi:hypothetical protein